MDKAEKYFREEFKQFKRDLDKVEKIKGKLDILIPHWKKMRYQKNRLSYDHPLIDAVSEIISEDEDGLISKDIMTKEEYRIFCYAFECYFHFASLDDIKISEDEKISIEVLRLDDGSDPDSMNTKIIIIKN